MSAFSGLPDILTPSGSKYERHVHEVRFLGEATLDMRLSVHLV